MLKPCSGTPQADSRSITVVMPAARVPLWRDTKPISFNNISAVLLSLLRRSSLTISDKGADDTAATTGNPVGVEPAVGDPAIVTPRSCNKRRNSWAAPPAGSVVFVREAYIAASLTTNPAIGPPSAARNPMGHVGT